MNYFQKSSLLFCMLVISTTASSLVLPHHVDSLLTVLDKEILQADLYIQQRELDIQSAKSKYYQDTTMFEATLEIAKLYAPYQCDSAIAWFGKAKACAGELWNDTLETYFQRCLSRKNGVDIPFEHKSILKEEHQYAIQTCYTGMLALQAGDTVQALEQLTKSALTDLRLAITDNGSIWVVAQLVYEIALPYRTNNYIKYKSQIERAYNYIEYSCHNSDLYNAQLRFVQIGPIAHAIAKTYRELLSYTWHWLKVFIITLILILLLLILFIIFYIRQNKKLHSLNRTLEAAQKQQEQLNQQLNDSNKELSEMNRTREQYICAYLEEKSENIRQRYKESLRAGKADSDEKFREQLDKYYQSFDATFLRLYPDFTQQFNNLLRLDAQITPPQGCLTPELRIFALIRLGITKSTRIAELLCLSNNTVYTYRSRVRGFAKADKDDFENAVRNI